MNAHVNVALACLATFTIAAATATSLPAQEQATQKVYFKWNERTLSDADRAKLLTILAAEIPASEWVEVTAQPGDGLLKIVDRYYDLFGPTSAGTRALPHSTRALVDAIVKANGLRGSDVKAGERLRIPPVPVRTASPEAVPDNAAESFRAFDAASRGYAWVGQSGRYGMSTGVEARPATSVQAWREASETIVALSEVGASQLGDIPGQFLTPDSVDVELLQAPSCLPADASIGNSPYLEGARRRLEASRAALDNKAKSRPIALIDFDFDRGHGRHVRSAAVWLLQNLNVRTLEKHVRDVELNPELQRVALGDVLARYWLYARALGVPSSQAAAASLWVLSEKPGTGKAVYSVPPAVLQAAIWDNLNRGAWLNLSWRIASSRDVFPVKYRDLLQTTKAFVAVAAGNEAADVRSDLSPQDGASLLSQFVNVTYGAPDGSLYGSWTSAAAGGKVDVTATGCGFAFDSLGPSQHGSSFASPIVLVSAWLKFLLDGTDATAMRQALIRASLLTPPMANRVIAGGTFDAGRLLTEQHSHFLDSDRRTITTFKSGQLVTNCGTFSVDPSRPGSTDLIVYARNGSFFLLRRGDDPASFPSIRVEPPCALTSLSFVADTSRGPLTIASPQDFVKQIGHLTL